MVNRISLPGVQFETFGWLLIHGRQTKRQQLFKFRKDALAAAKKADLPESEVVAIVMSVCEPTEEHV